MLALQALAGEGRLKRYSGHGHIVAVWCPLREYQCASDVHGQRATAKTRRLLAVYNKSLLTANSFGLRSALG